jgi:hypothetical protein
LARVAGAVRDADCRRSLMSLSGENSNALKSAARPGSTPLAFRFDLERSPRGG